MTNGVADPAKRIERSRGHLPRSRPASSRRGAGIAQEHNIGFSVGPQDAQGLAVGRKLKDLNAALRFYREERITARRSRAFRAELARRFCPFLNAANTPPAKAGLEHSGRLTISCFSCTLPAPGPTVFRLERMGGPSGKKSLLAGKKSLLGLA